MFGVKTSIKIRIFQNAQEAIDAGFIYRDKIKPVEIETAVIVKNGTEDNNSTIDLLIVDTEGNRFVTLITANLLKAVIAAA